jgi:pyruvate formate-lyase/glycerol dehydratase family glycyl radical enzyme
MNPPLTTLKDLSLKDYNLTPRVKDLREIYFRAMPEICTERPRLITEYSLAHDLFRKTRISILDKARLYRHVLENRTAIVRHTHGHDKGMTLFELNDRSLFAGSTSSKFKGVLLYPEFVALTLWPELWTLSTRAANPYYIADQDVKDLNEKIFPHWMKNTIMELTRKRCYQDNREKYGPKCAPEMKLLELLVFFITSKPACISHTIPDFSRAIRSGLRQLIDEANDKKRQTSDQSKKDFYEAMSEVFEGIITYSKRLSAKAQKMADRERDGDLKQELLGLAEIYARVPESPARTFREGLTTLWICWTAVLLENANLGLSLGRLDQVLFELYRDDMEAKRLTIEQALELICCLWLKIGDHVPAVPETSEQLFGGSGSNQAITIGGIDQKGKDAVNDLTYVILRATELLRLRDPNLNARYYPGKNSKDYLRRLCEVNISTRATPAIHNDRAVIKALTNKGETLEQARDYGIIGCVEPNSNGRSYSHPAAILLNLTSVLELTLYNGRHRHTGDELISKETGDPSAFKSFDDFRKAFEEQTSWLVDQATTLNNLLGKTHQDFYPTPILSAFFEGPMDSGKDLIQGGAVLNSSGATIIGLADVADSLSAIQMLVYDERSISFPELLGTLQEDFKDYEVLQRRLMNPEKTPKYGYDDPRHPIPDENVTWIVRMLDRLFYEKKNYRGGRYRVGYWTMTNHAGFGRLTKALPSGRKAGENFASGITPVSGVTPDLTRTLNSVAKLPVECLSNGIALNMKFTPEQKDNMLDRFVSYVEGYFDSATGTRDGGMEIQFNIRNHQEFVDAFANPDKSPNFLVRVSGYTAYFKDLNQQMQKEIIDRTEYLLSTGKAVEFPPIPLPGKT